MSSYRSSYQPPRRGIHHSAARKLGVAVEIVVAAAAVLAVIGGLIAWAIQYEYGSQATLTFKITQVTNIATGSNGHEYDVYTSNNDVLANSDSLMHGKFDSANVQSWLTNHIGQVVECPTYGYRIFVLSSKKIILDGCKVAPAGAKINY